MSRLKKTVLNPNKLGVANIYTGFFLDLPTNPILGCFTQLQPAPWQDKPITKLLRKQ